MTGRSMPRLSTTTRVATRSLGPTEGGAEASIGGKVGRNRVGSGAAAEA
jgi:hypothetical protein